jgi:hypothetical protein
MSETCTPTPYVPKTSPYTAKVSPYTPGQFCPIALQENGFALLLENGENMEL